MSLKNKNQSKKPPKKPSKNKPKRKDVEAITKKKSTASGSLGRIIVSSGLKNKKLPLRERLKEQLKASRFRYFNEQFYISSSSEAKDYFSQHPDEFQAYHDGYEHQAALWPNNPIDEFIKELHRRPKLDKKEIIADFGCGQAKLAQSLSTERYKVFSFDFVAVNSHVTACDMANTKLFNNSVDIAIFCLSLMGSNISQYIREANRVLKDGGIMKIAEVKSRFNKVDDFVNNIEAFGFHLTKKNLTNSTFYYFDFRKKSSISKNKKRKLPDIELKPCLYKYR